MKLIVRLICIPLLLVVSIATGSFVGTFMINFIGLPTFYISQTLEKIVSNFVIKTLEICFYSSLFIAPIAYIILLLI